ncbi:hypothetical protein CC2G_002700 [Coprinopsis cinerea AmutBmut pab1-1]|nr:hypothetical protein CC2G_002700 [Coprinopsis cinerea AmutBmut pab1-1]
MSTSSRRSSTSHSNSQSRRTVHGPGPWRSPSTSSLFRGSNGGRGSPISVGKGAPSVGSTAAPSLGTAAPSVGVAVPITATAELSMVTAQPEISVNNSDSRSIRSARGSIFSGNGDSASGSASRNGSTSARESVERVVRRSASNLSRVSVHSHGHGSANGYGYGGSRNGTGSASRSTSRTGSGRVSDTLRRDRPSTAYLKDREAIEKLEERLESLTGDQHLTAAERVIQETLEDAATAARPYHHHHQGQQYDSGFDSPASAPPDLQRQEVPTMSSDSTATGSGITTPTTTATTTATTPTSDKEDIHKEAKEAITSASSDAVKMGTEAITSLDHAAAGSSSSMATTSTASLPQALASSSTTTTTTTTATAAPSSSTEGVSATPTSLATPASATSASAPAPSSTSTRPKSSSWFASFGRSKGRSAKMDFDSVDSSRSSHNGSGSGSGGSGGGDRVEGPQQAQSSSTSTTYQKPSASTSTVYQKPSVAKDEGEDEEDYPPMISITDAFPAPQQIVSPVEASFGAPPAPTSASTPVSQSSPASSTEPRAVHSSPAPTSTHPPSAPTSTHPPSVPAPALEPTRSPPAQATKSAPMRTPPPKKRSWFYSSTPSSSSNSSTPSVGSPLARVVYSSSTGGVSSEDVIDGIGANEGSGGRDRGVSLCMDVNDGSGGGGGVSGAALVDALEDLSASVATIVPTRRAVDETAIPSISTSALVATTAEDATTDATTAGGTNATTTTAVTMVDTMTTATMADTAEDTSTSSKMSIRIPHPSENLPSALPSSIDDRVPSLPSTPAGTATTGGGLFGLVVPYFGVGRKSGGVTGKEKEKEEGKGKDGSARKQDEPAIESDEPSSFKASSGPDHHPSNSLEEKDSSIQSEGHTGQEELGAGTTSQADSTSTMKTNPYPDSSELSGLPSSEPSDLASQSQSEQPTSTAPPLTSQVSGSAKEAELEDDDAKEVKLKENGAKEGKLKDNTDEKDTVSVKDKDRNRDRVGFGFGFGLPGLGLGVSAAKGSVDVKKQDVTKEKKKQENVHEEEEEKVNVNANEEKEKEASSSSGGASSGRGRGRGGAVSVDETPIMADGKGSVDGGLSGEGESPRDGNDVANGDMPNEGNGTAKTTGGSDGEREALGQGGEGKAVGEEGVDATGKAEGVEAGDGSSSESGTNGGGGVIAWISPWAWYYTGTTTTTTTTTTTDEGPTTLPSTSPSSAPETESSSGSNGGRTASEGLTLPEENGNKGDGSGDRNKVGDDRDGGEGEEGTRGESPSNASATASSQDPKEGSKKDDGVEGGDGARAGVESLGETNPIEASIQANRSGWASFFSSRALMVKAIGYGSEPAKKEDEVKRDEHGAEIMDIDESDDEGQGSTLGGGDDGAKGDQEKDKKDVSSLVVATTKALIPQLPIKSSSASTKSSKSDSSKDVKPEPPAEKPAPPLTRDEDLKDKVTDSVPTTKPGSKPSSGKSTPVPVSPSKSTMNKDSPKEKEKARSAPVTPKRNNSPAPSTKKAGPPPPPNLVLPTWDDIFHTPPRSVVPPPPPLSRSNSSSEDSSPGPSTSTILGKTMKFVSGVLFSKDDHQSQQQSHQRARSSSQVRRGSTSGNRHSSSSRPTNSSRLRRSSSGVGGVGGPLDLGTLLEQERQKRFERFGEELPKAWKVLHNGTIGSGGSPAPIEGVEVGLGDTSANTGVNATIGTRVPGLGDSQGQAIHDVLRGCRRVVVIGVHGWFPGAVMRTVLGEPTGTSSKFANMMEQALREFEDAHGVQLEKVTKIPLEGEGTIQRRVERLYSNLLANSEWMGDLHEADAVIVATHSQGSVVSTHLLDRLIADKHIRPSVEPIEVSGADSFPSAVGVNVSPGRKPQRVCCLALCGIHLGPLRYLSGSSLVQPYIQYFESTAARELFEFQNTESAVSKAYVQALRNVLHHGVKMVYIASLNDQVVPIYSGIFTAASHPMILRALYIDGDAYHSSDFLSNLLVLLLRLRNSGIPDGGLIAHLSEATAGSLSGIGHSTAYEELSCYSLAVRYLFEANDGLAPYPDLQLESFDAAHEQNDYEIPWSLRDVIADERVIHYFSKEVSQLRDAFREWQPKTTILRDLKRKLQPIQRLPSSFSSTIYSTTSKL